MERYTKSVSIVEVNGRYRYVRGEPCVVIEQDGTRHEQDGSDVTDEELAMLNGEDDAS